MQGDGITRQIRPGSIVEGIVSKGQPKSHALSACYLARDIDNGGSIMRLFADVFSFDVVVFKGNPGIIFQVVPAAGTGPVECFAANSNARTHRNNQGVGGRLAVYSVCSDIGAFDIRRNIIFYIVIGNARASTSITVPATTHGSRDGDALVLA